MGDSTRIHVATGAEDAARRLSSLPSACVVAQVPGARDGHSLDELLRLRAQFPHVPMLAVYADGISALDATLHLGRAGVTEILTASPEVDRVGLAATLSRCHSAAVAVQVWDRAALSLPGPMVTLLKVALRLANRPFTVEDLAVAAGMSIRSLRRYCEREGLPGPQWIVGWARILTAGYFLAGSGRSTSEVAQTLGYPSSDALRNQLRRYTGAATGDLRAAGLLGRLGADLAKHVRDHDADHRGGSPSERA